MKGTTLMNLSVAIDGPAGAGKSTIAKLLAKRFNLMYINTGAMYRAVTLFALKENVSYKDTEKLISLTKNLRMKFVNDDLYVNDEDISEHINTTYISSNVSNYAAVPEVRKILVYLQQNMAKEYGVVMDGRDIGTVVLKDAPHKFFLTASAEERAKRRFDELILKGEKVSYDDILKKIIERDELDTNRETDPLRQAEDAVLIDSSNLNIDEVVDLMASYIKGSKNV